MAARNLVLAAAAMLLAGSEWGIEQSPDVFLQFRSEGEVSGFTGCNRVSGRYTQDGARVTIEALAATRMACPEDVMAREQALIELLGKVREVEASHLKLVLKDGEGKQLEALVRRDFD